MLPLPVCCTECVCFVVVVGCVLIGVDQHSCVYVMRTMNTRDPVTEVPPVYLVNMFEYLLTSGFDFSDVLTAVKSGITDRNLLILTFYSPMYSVGMA